MRQPQKTLAFLLVFAARDVHATGTSETLEWPVSITLRQWDAGMDADTKTIASTVPGIGGLK